MLLKAPKHPWLTKWIKALRFDLKEMRAKRDSNVDFTRFHEAFNKQGVSKKDASNDNWKIYVTQRDVDSEMVIKSVPYYFAWCKKQDRPLLNGEGFLKASAWEWNEVEETGKKTKTCPKCHNEVAKLHYHSYKDSKGCGMCEYICMECKNLC